jgi:hypothetical protein
MAARCATVTVSARERRERDGTAVHDGTVKVPTRKVYMESKTSKSEGGEKTYEKWSQIQYSSF